MGLLQQDKAIFYHPLDDRGERIESKTWTKASGNFAAAKVDGGLFREDTGAELSGLSADYAAAVGATKVAFCGWFRRPSSAPARTAAPAVDSPIGDGATSVSGTGVTGATATVYVNGGGTGTAPVTGGSWTKAVAALSAGDAVKATQRSPGELESGYSGTVTVQAYSAAPAVTGPIGNGATSVSGTGVNGSTVEVFVGGGSAGNADGVVTGGTWTKAGMSALSTGNAVKAKQTETGKLQSLDSNEVTVQAYSAAPAVTSPIWDGATSVSGTGVNGSTVEVFVGGSSVGNADAVVSGGMWTKTGMSALSTGNSVTAKQTESGKLQGPASGAVTVQAAGFGAEAEFRAGSGDYNSIAKLDADRFVVAHRDIGDSGHGKAKVGTVSGTDIAFGAPTEFRDGQSDKVSVAVLDAGKFVVAYRDRGDADNGTAKVGTVSGAGIEFGAETDFLSSSPSGPSYVSVTALSSSKFVVAYSSSSDSFDGKAKVGTVSGTNITFGAEAEFLGGGIASYISVAALDANKFIVAYRDGGDSSHGTAKVGTVSGTAIAFGAEAEFMSASSAYYISAAALGSGKFVVAYADGNDGKGLAKVGTVSGTDITFGAETEFLPGTGNGAEHVSAAALSATKFVVAYRDATIPVSNHGTVKIGTVSGTAIAFSAETEFLSANGAIWISAAALGADKFAVAYTDDADSSNGTARAWQGPA